VFGEQGSQLIAGLIAIERLDRIADVHLVLQQTLCSGISVWQAGKGADDVDARPGNVIFPEFAHCLLEDERIDLRFRI
jgi:hypothetical protein